MKKQGKWPGTWKQKIRNRTLREKPGKNLPLGNKKNREKNPEPVGKAPLIKKETDCQYGADGIVFDKEGNLYVGNFGDGEVIKIIVDEKGDFVEQFSYAKDWSQLESTDGMIFDENGNLYIADFCANAIARVSPDGKVTRIAQSPDTDGLNGELDQPGEPIIWDGKIIVSCFDLVTGPGKVNTAHEMPATMSELDLE